jgi:hypothetical protein
MYVRNFGFGLLAVWVAVTGGGCKKSEPAAPPQDQQAKSAPNAQPLAPAGNAIARVHWLGKNQLARETNAAYFMGIWNMPETLRLEGQTLDKLALALWPSAITNRSEEITNYAPLVAGHPSASLLRPLLQDVLEGEAYLEVRQGTNQPSELALAVRMSDAGAATWQSNLAAVVESLTGTRPSPAAGAYGWRLDTGHPDERGWSSVSLARAGDWTVVGLGGAGATNSPSLAADFSARIQRDHAPFARPATNYWVDADVDLLKLTSELKLNWFSWASKVFSQPSTNLNLPRAMVTFIGDGENVRTRAELEFPQPLGLPLEAWNVPTNLIHDPLIGFMAVRGLRPTLQAFKPWNDLKLGPPPNQAFFWAQQGMPQDHFMALPSAQANDLLSKLENYILNVLNPIFMANPLKAGGFVKAPGSDRIAWRGIPLFSPSVDVGQSGGALFLTVAFTTNQAGAQPMPGQLLQQVDGGTTNLVSYDWEMTGACIQGLTPMFNLVRRAFYLPRLPAEPAVAWFNAVPPKLGNTITVVYATGPTRLLVNRKSHLGFSAAELELLMDWLESPDFPCGLHTFRAPQ